jgi:hypothetical protein
MELLPSLSTDERALCAQTAAALQNTGMKHGIENATKEGHVYAETACESLFRMWKLANLAGLFDDADGQRFFMWGTGKAIDAGTLAVYLHYLGKTNFRVIGVDMEVVALQFAPGVFAALVLAGLVPPDVLSCTVANSWAITSFEGIFFTYNWGRCTLPCSACTLQAPHVLCSHPENQQGNSQLAEQLANVSKTIYGQICYLTFVHQPPLPPNLSCRLCTSLLTFWRTETWENSRSRNPWYVYSTLLCTL